MTATYWRSQPRSDPYASRNAVPVSGTVPSSYPYTMHKPSESQVYSSQRSVSPTATRSRPRASTSASTLRNDYAFASSSAGSSRQQHPSTIYNGHTTTSSQRASPARQRSRSQPRAPSQTRYRTPAQQMNPSYPYGYWPSSNLPPHPTIPGILDTGRDGPVIPTDDFMRQAMAEEMEEERRATSSRRSHEHPSRAQDRHGYGGASIPAYSYPTQHPVRTMAGTSVPAPPRPPTSASRYPFANYRGPESVNRDREGRERRPSNAQDTHQAPPYGGVASSQADSTASDPLIHPALGWWPDQGRPALHWDLSSRSRPRYTKRDFDNSELASSPFTPPISRMRLVLDPRARWVFDLFAPRGQGFISLKGLFDGIMKLMYTRNIVPHAYWVRASSTKKEAILRAMLRRTGKPLPVPPPHRRPKTRGQIMEEAVVEGAPSGYTNLLVVDLLCEDVMFAGLEFHKEPAEWVLRTTRRHS